MTRARERLESRMSRAEFIALMSAVMATGALAIDMMLPAFGEMRAEFGLAPDSNQVALVVTSFFVGLGLGQPLWGPLSDALGRKRVLWAGLAVYVLGAVGSMLSSSLPVLLVWRFVGGCGAAAMRVVSQSVIRDAYSGRQMASVLSTVMAVFILVPIVAPSLGALVLRFGSWQAVFGVTVLFAGAVALWQVRLPETLPRRLRLPMSPARFATAARTVVTSRFVMGLTMAQTAAFGFFTSYLGSSQLIVSDVLGVAEWFPAIFAASAATLGLGMLVNTRLLRRFALSTVLRLAMRMYLGATLLFAIEAWTTGGEPPLWLFGLGLAPVLFSHALVIPNLNSAAMVPMGSIAGTAAAVIGSVAMLGGALVGAVIDRTYDGTVLPMAIASAIGGVVAYGCYRWGEAARS